MDLQEKLEKAKAWYKSKTIIGVIIGFVPTFIKLVFDVEVDVNAGVENVWEMADTLVSFADGLYGKVMTTVGSILAIYGRLVASVKIKKE